MKKVLTICALGALSLSVYAQGLVTIQTTSFTFSTNSTDVGASGTSGKMVGAANGYYFELLVQSDASGSTTTPGAPTMNPVSGQVTGIAGWTDTGVSGTNYTGINAGHINAILGNPGATAGSWAGGSTNFFIIVGWSANEGSSWATVSSEALNGSWTVANNATGVFGISAVGYGASTSLSPGFAAFGANPGEVGAFVLNGIVTTPEPATMALAAIGGASLLLFRRKK